MIEVNSIVKLQLQEQFSHGSISLVTSHPGCALIEASQGYIPKTEFQQMFFALGSIVKQHEIKRVVFDKSKLTVFHQPSMEWYFLFWKEEMYHHGLTVHRKILPPDIVFKESARIARNAMEKNYPDAKFLLMDIKYSPSILEALVK